MTREVSEKTITSDLGTKHKYVQQQFGADRGFQLLLDWTEIFGEVGGHVGEAFFESDQDKFFETGEKEDAAFNPVAMGKAVSMASKEIRKAGGLKFIKEMLEFVSRENEDGEMERCGMNFDTIYKGNYGELFQAVWFSIDGNFGPSWRSRLQGRKLNIMNVIMNKAISRFGSGI